MMSAPLAGAAAAASSGQQQLRKAAAANNVDNSEVDQQPPVDDVVLATGGYDHTIKFWQAHTGHCTRTLPHNDSQVNALAISPDGLLLAACGYQHIKMFDVQGTNANPVVNYEGVQKNVMSVGFQEESRWMYTGGEDGTAKIWDLRMRNLNCSRQYATSPQQNVGGLPPNSSSSNANLSPVNSLKLHPNQQELIIGDQNGNVHIWDIRQKPENATVITPQPGASIQSVAIDPQGVFMAAVTNKGSCHVWQLKKSVMPPPSTPPASSSTAANSDGQTAPTQPPQIPSLQQQHSQLVPELKKSFVAHKRYALKCVFSPDSKLLATTSADQTAKLWRTADLSLATTLHVPNQRWVWDLAFSADSQCALTASSDNLARLWSIPTKEVKREYKGHSKAVISLAFRDGQAS